jgi:hypothetical protein
MIFQNSIFSTTDHLHLFFIVGVCVYSSLFVSHNILVKAVLSVVSIIILKKLYLISKNEMTKSTIENISIKKEGTIENLIIFYKWKWLDIDTPFLNTVIKIEYLNTIDKQIYIELCSNMNKFSKTYYTNIRKNEKTNYRNLEHHKQNIQDLEMLYEDILNILLNISFVTSSHVYKKFLKIPSLIKFMDDLMKQRIYILKQKYKLN